MTFHNFYLQSKMNFNIEQFEYNLTLWLRSIKLNVPGWLVGWLVGRFKIPELVMYLRATADVQRRQTQTHTHTHAIEYE